LGLLRAVMLNTVALATAIWKTRQNNRHVPWGTIFVASLKWFLPLKKSFEGHVIFSFTSMLFHVAVIIVPIFLGAHILLWERGLGISWPAISNTVADNLTLIAIATAIVLFVMRVGALHRRAISRFQDYLLPPLIALPFITGYLAMHPELNPFGYHGTMFVHVMSGNLILFLFPFTKMSHVALFPGTQLISDLGWHLEPDSGQRVALILGKENEPI
jgi:hypothetical protein